MKLLITGSREASQRLLHLAYKAVERCKKLGWEIIVGDAPGIDSAVIRACDDLGVPVEVHGAYNKIRNATKTGENVTHNTSYPGRDRIMASKCDQCLALWNGKSRGTKITFELVEMLGKKVNVIKV